MSSLLASLLATTGCSGNGSGNGAGATAPGDDAGTSSGSDGATPAPDLAPAAGDDGGAPPDLAPALTTIRIHYPADTHFVALRGDGAPLTWSTGVKLTQAADGSFTYTFATPPPSRVEFKPLLDDATWSHGPNYAVEPGHTVDVYPHFFATKGKVVKLFNAFHSNALNNDRVVWAYLPPSYDENPGARYPVLYMHDGQNLFDPSLAFGGNEWMVDETLDAAIEGDGKTVKPIREIIVVGPENDAQRIYEYTPTFDATENGGGGGDLYLKMLVGELKPAVDGMLRTLPGRDTTGVMGSSLGGLISVYAGIKHPATYGIVGAMSPSTWWDNRVILGDVMQMGPQPARPELLYVDCGDPGDDSDNTKQLVADYLSLGYVEGQDFFHVYQAGAQHNEVYWAQRLPAALAFLFPPR